MNENNSEEKDYIFILVKFMNTDLLPSLGFPCVYLPCRCDQQSPAISQPQGACHLRTGVRPQLRR